VVASSWISIPNPRHPLGSPVGLTSLPPDVLFFLKRLFSPLVHLSVRCSSQWSCALPGPARRLQTKARNPPFPIFLVARFPVTSTLDMKLSSSMFALPAMVLSFSSGYSKCLRSHLFRTAISHCTLCCSPGRPCLLKRADSFPPPPITVDAETNLPCPVSICAGQMRAFLRTASHSSQTRLLPRFHFSSGNE